MKINTLRSLSALAFVGALSACGGGGGGGNDAPSVSAPIQGLSMSDLESRTGARDGQATNVDNLIRSGGSGATRYNGTITFNAAEPGEQDVLLVVDTAPGTEFDSYASLRLHSEDQNTRVGNQDAVRTEVINVGGQQALIAEGRQAFDGQNEFNDRRAIVYVPRNDAQQMYAGGVVDHYNGAATHGIFGVETTAAQLSAQNGDATYSGISAASIFQENPANPSNEDGFYAGTANAAVDFENRTVGITGSMDNDDGHGTIGISSTGVFDVNGNVTGTIALDGVGLTGDLQGNFYGPGAQTLGATFGASDNDNTAVGQVLMNR